MFDVHMAEEWRTTDDGFTLVEGAGRVRPEQFESPAPLHLLGPVIGGALCSAAADDGSLFDFDVIAFYEQNITEAIGRDNNRRPLTYDAFVAMTLTEMFEWLRNCGYLAHRGNGDSYDYWLAKPAT